MVIDSDNGGNRVARKSAFCRVANVDKDGRLAYFATRTMRKQMENWFSLDRILLDQIRCTTKVSVPNAVSYLNRRLYKHEAKQGKVSAAEAQFNTIVKENEIKLSEQRKSKHGGVSTKLRGFLKPTGWKPLTILFLFFSFQQFSGIYITLFYAVTWFQVNNYFSSTFTA